MGWGLNLWSLRMCFFSWKLFCTAHHMKFLKFAQQLVTLSFKNNECSLWLTVLSLMFFAYLLPVSWLHLIYWTVFPSLPWLFPPQNFDSCQVTAPYLCLFFLTSQLSFKAILKPNLNFFFNWQQCSWQQSLCPLEILQHSKATGVIWYLCRFSIPHHSLWALQLQDHKLFIFTFLSIIPNTPSAPLSILNILCAHLLLIGLFKWTNACMHAESLQSCPTLCNPMESSPPGSSVQGIL